MKADYSEKNLRKVVLESKSVRQCLLKLYLTAGGNNDKTFKKYIKLYDISIEHFNNWNSEKKKFLKKVPIEDVLVEHSNYSRGSLKKRLYNEGLRERKCELCGQGEEWRDKKMSLILDHINGVNNDNRIENLRIVCPNCNATLDTHCGKNNKLEKKKHFCKCGKEKYKTAKMCKECKGKEQRRVVRPKIGQLKKDIEVLGYVGTGKKYGVSDNAIRKWIENYNKVNKKQCPVCGKTIWFSASMCKECSDKNKRKIERPSFDVLKKEIEKNGYAAIGRKYKVTDNTIRKWMGYYEKVDIKNK